MEPPQWLPLYNCHCFGGQSAMHWLLYSLSTTATSQLQRLLSSVPKWPETGSTVLTVKVCYYCSRRVLELLTLPLLVFWFLIHCDYLFPSRTLISCLIKLFGPHAILANELKSKVERPLEFSKLYLHSTYRKSPSPRKYPLVFSFIDW